MYIDHDRELIFFHIPRTGGSSIKSALNLHDKLCGTNFHSLPHEIPDDCKDYFKFCFVRNPFDRFISIYEYQRSDEYHGDPYNAKIAKFFEFNDWLTRWSAANIQQIRWSFAVDHVGKYENLEDEMKSLFNVKIPKENVVLRNLDTTYNKAGISVVEKLSKDDLMEFGYTFDGYSRI